MEQQAGISKNSLTELSIRSYAHIGDAVYEVFAREKTIFLAEKPDKLHKMTIALVNAEFQAYLLGCIQNFMNEEEQEIVRRARNLAVTTARRTNQKIHRLSTAFEALVGFLYLKDTNRLTDLYDYINPLIQAELSKFID